MSEVKFHAGFLGSNGQFFSICPPHQRGAELVPPHLGLNDAGSRGKQHKIVSLVDHVKVRDDAVRQKMVKEGLRDDIFLWDLRLYVAGRQVVVLVEALGLPAAEVCHKPSH